MGEPSGAVQSKRAMLWSTLAAQYAGEPYVTRSRIVAALLRTESAAGLSSRANIDLAALLEAVDDPGTLSFCECERVVHDDLAAKGLVLGSAEQFATVRLRPIDPAIRSTLDAVIDRYGYMGASPIELLLAFVEQDPAFAARLATHGLTVETLRTGITTRPT